MYDSIRFGNAMGCIIYSYLLDYLCIVKDLIPFPVLANVYTRRLLLLMKCNMLAFFGAFFKQSCTSGSKSKGKIKKMFLRQPILQFEYHQIYFIQCFVPGKHDRQAVGQCQCMSPDHLTSVVGLI